MKTHAIRAQASDARRLVRPHCPECRDLLFAPAVSVHVNERDVRHWWSCDNCGHEFMTTATAMLARAAQGTRLF